MAARDEPEEAETAEKGRRLEVVGAMFMKSICEICNCSYL